MTEEEQLPSPIPDELLRRIKDDPSVNAIRDLLEAAFTDTTLIWKVHCS